MNLPGLLRRLTANPRRAVLAVLAVVVLLVLAFTRPGGGRTPERADGTTDQPAATSAAPFPTGADTEPATATPPPAATSPTAGDGATTNPTAGTDGNDDPALPTTGTGTDTAAVTAAATTLTAKILNTYGKTPDQWRASFAGLLTPAEAGRYATADPAGVPSGTIAATPPTVEQAGAQVETVHVPVTTPDGSRPLGTVDLTMVASTGGAWLAEAIGWTATR